MRWSVVKLFALSAALTAIFAAPVAARAPEIYMNEGGLFSKAWSYAADGNDVVAYFSLEQDAAPVAGSDDWIADFMGQKWRFSSEENLQAFQADPHFYAPQFGSYCAWAMARNKLAKGDPAIWTVYEGKLYLNISKRYQRQWIKNIDRDIARAIDNWPVILDRN